MQIRFAMHRFTLRRAACVSMSSFAFGVMVLGAACAGATGVEVQVQVRNADGKALPDTVIYIEAEGAAASSAAASAASATTTAAITTSAKSAKAATGAEIEQKGLKFVPLVTVVQTGSTVLFPNNDKVRHHIYSFSVAHKFDQKLYSGQSATPQVFDKAGTVVLGCNIHDKMLAYVKVVDTPYFAKTDATGAARIELPGAGNYVVKAWHYNTAGGATAEQVLAVKAGAALSTAIFKLAMKPPAPADAPSSSAY